MTRRILGTLVALVLVVAGATVMDRREELGTIEMTAHFDRAVGLFPGSSVRVLGVKVGVVTAVEPQGRSVRVTMRVPDDTRIPAGASAVIVPPSLVSDRYVQLHPVWNGGPTLADGADIPLARTRVPVELDEILGSLDRLLVAIGPDGANADGSLARLIETGAGTLGGGNGKRLNATLTDFADAITTLAEGRDDLAGVIENLASFSATLARNDEQIRTVTASLAAVSEQLAGEREALERALANLSVALGEVASLVRTHRVSLVRDIDTLAQVTQTVLSDREQLIEALDLLPLLVTNIEQAFNPERKTLDIRNNNEQGPTIDQILLCQLLGVNCPPTTQARGPRGLTLAEMLS
jgi:phospholipid/cholesterol/gamma-HCH transport system substrate-binding protein